MSNTKQTKPKRLLSLFLALVMVVGMLPAMSITAAAYTAGDIEGTTGTGTVEDPVVCDTFAEFKAAMENTEIICVKLLCKNELMNYIVDKFGDEVETSPTDDSHFKAVVEVSVSQTFFAWVFQFNGEVKVTNPSAVVSRYREMLENALK